MMVSVFPLDTQVTLIWNENIQFTKEGRKLVIASIDVEDPKKWEMEVRDPATYKIAEAGYTIIIKGEMITAPMRPYLLLTASEDQIQYRSGCKVLAGLFSQNVRGNDVLKVQYE